MSATSVSKTSVDGISFDMGNTLIMDPFDEILRMKATEFRKTFSEFGYSISTEDLSVAWSEANNKIDYPHICHFYQESPIVENCLDLLRVGKEHKIQLATKLLIIYRSGIKPVIMKDDRLENIRNSLSVLREKGKRLMVFSNGRQKSLDLFLGWTGLSEFFINTTSSEKLGIEKPNSLVFNYILKVLATKNEKSIYIGDDPYRDIFPIKRSGIGMLAGLYEPPKKVSTKWRDYDAKIRTKPDLKFNDFSVLPELLK